MSAARDPQPYGGPIERYDGGRPFNGFLWPTEVWVFYLDNPSHPHVVYDMRIEIVALADGRVSTCGWVHGIEKNRDFWGAPCVYASRREAIRVSAARMIRSCRRIVRGSWRCMGVRADTAPAIIGWARTVVARETGGPAPRPISPFFAPPPPPPPARSGLPLFDYEAAP